jgi:hypothetical protein
MRITTGNMSSCYMNFNYLAGILKRDNKIKRYLSNCHRIDGYFSGDISVHQNKDPRKKIKYLGSDFDIEENGAS